MTQPTIKEKIQALLDRPRNPDHPDQVAMQQCIDWNDAILKDFARLICEEMEVELDNAEYDNDYGMGEKDGWNRRESYLRDKAQEILKALE